MLTRPAKSERARKSGGKTGNAKLKGVNSKDAKSAKTASGKQPFVETALGKTALGKTAIAKTALAKTAMAKQALSRTGLFKSAPADKPPADEVRFLHNWLQDPLRTGAVSPSGKALAAMMASYVDPAEDGPVIELGPGTGPVTQALIDRGVAPERLVLIEYNPEFCTLLKARFPAARVIRGDAYDMVSTLGGPLDRPATAVVSSLPLFTKPVPMRHGLLHQAFSLSRSGAPFIQFTYAVVSPVPLAPERMDAHVSPRVWKNLPPARVWVYRSVEPRLAAG